MYPPGHAGIAVLLFAPVAYALLCERRERATVAWLSVALLASFLPDVDVFLPGLLHRGITHTLPFSVLVGGTVAALAWLSGGRDAEVRRERGALGFLVGAVAVLGHLLGDVITPMGVRPLYPVLPAGHTFDLVYARDPAANAVLLVVGLCLFAVALHRGRARGVAAATDDREDERPVPRAGRGQVDD